MDYKLVAGMSQHNLWRSRPQDLTGVPGRKLGPSHMVSQFTIKRTQMRCAGQLESRRETGWLIHKTVSKESFTRRGQGRSAAQEGGESRRLWGRHIPAENCQSRLGRMDVSFPVSKSAFSLVYLPGSTKSPGGNIIDFIVQTADPSQGRCRCVLQATLVPLTSTACSGGWGGGDQPDPDHGALGAGNSSLLGMDQGMPQTGPEPLGHTGVMVQVLRS